MPKRKTQQYQVGPNESLLQIAQGNNLSYQDLLKANPGINRVSTGQVISLPSPRNAAAGRTPLFWNPWAGAVGQTNTIPPGGGLGVAPVGTTLGQSRPIPQSQIIANRNLDISLQNIGRGISRTFQTYGQIDNAPLPYSAMPEVGRPDYFGATKTATDLFRPSSNIPSVKTAQQLDDLRNKIMSGDIPNAVNPQDATALGFTTSDMIRAGYQLNPREGLFFYRGELPAATTAAPVTSTGAPEGEGGLRPGTLGYAVQQELQAGHRGKAGRLQKYENYLNRQKYSWTDASRQKARRDAKRQRAQQAQFQAAQQQQQQQQQQSQSLSSTAAGFGLISTSWRTATG